MAAASWAWKVYTLSEAAENIGELLQSIQDGLNRMGFTEVTSGSQGHGYYVSGWQGDAIVLVFYWFLGGRDFGQTASCYSASASSSSETDALNGSVITMIDNIAFL
jgi:hypothetical protein